jgi:hypothetical protein
MLLPLLPASIWSNDPNTTQEMTRTESLNIDSEVALEKFLPHSELSK